MQFKLRYMLKRNKFGQTNTRHIFCSQRRMTHLNDTHVSKWLTFLMCNYPYSEQQKFEANHQTCYICHTR